MNAVKPWELIYFGGRAPAGMVKKSKIKTPEASDWRILILTWRYACTAEMRYLAGENR